MHESRDANPQSGLSLGAACLSAMKLLDVAGAAASARHTHYSKDTNHQSS
jgi:hypothetical protein